MVHHLRGESIAAYVNDVCRVNASGYDDIVEYRRERLCQVLRVAVDSEMHCYDYVRKHRGQINRNNVDAIFNDLPLLSKEELRQSMIEHGKPQNITVDYRSTSGSTGIPFEFYKDRSATGYLDAVLYAAYAWHGITAGEPQARFWGVPLSAKGAVTSKLKDMLKNRIRFSAFDLSSTAMDRYYDQLVSFRPTYFYGYPSLIVEFCRYALKTGKNLTGLNLKAVVGTGEYVCQDEKNLIETATATRFVNEYGCTEVGIIGFECEHENMHVMAGNIHMEIINNGMNVVDEEGDVYVTELNTRCLPFIRYGLGDRGIVYSRSCPCGRSLPLVKIMSGRKDDYVLTPDGRKVYDAIFAYTLKKGVHQFKAVQKDLSRIEINICPTVEYSQELEKSYIKELQHHLGESMAISITTVPRIERACSGKLRYFHSELR